MSSHDPIANIQARILQGGDPKYHEKNREQGKMFARDRIAKLLDAGSFVEDALFANAVDAELPADGVIIGTGTMDGRTVAVMANDSTVKAGSWGRRTVEKIIRIQQTALALRCPLFYLVDSAGARITDQVEMFPGRQGAGRIFHNEVQLSGLVPQVCLLFGPSAAGGAYIPAFCDVVFMVQNNASMYLGSPRMAEMVIGEKVTLEEMGGARMHCTVSGCGDLLCGSEDEAIDKARAYLRYMPQHCGARPACSTRTDAAVPEGSGKPWHTLVPADENVPFDMFGVIREVIDRDSWFEIKPLFAKEVLTGFARLDGEVVGVVANQPKHLGGILFVDSADKSARFIQLCNAFNIPLLFFADVPGFMIGTKVERQGIIRAGAKMIAAVSAADVPKVCIVVRKAYGAGLYAMCGPAFDPIATLALPTASIAVMGPQAAVNAVYYNKIQQVPAGADRDAYVAKLRDEYRSDVNLVKLASELVVDAVIEGPQLRDEIGVRVRRAMGAYVPPQQKKHMVMPM
jgi:acetyl-CoA carboxylase carboxyltransferase component